MEIIEKHLDEIEPYERNPRKNDEAVAYVANSIKEFGFKVPIVIDKDGIIVAGHTRYKAARKLHLDTVPCGNDACLVLSDGRKGYRPICGGGSVRGLVSAFTGRDYVGMDLRQEQIDANEKNYAELEGVKDFFGAKLRHPTWLCGDSTTITERVDGEYDFLLTCPPYADLEKYSDDPRDISNMEYPQFIGTYREIIAKATSLLKENSYAVCVIGEVRSSNGDYYNFVSDTIQAFKDAGLRYYNEIILKTVVGTGALRANRTFGTYRKVVKMHQNILVFVKGDEKKIKLDEYNYEFGESEE